MPSFFGYLVWSGDLLLPVMALLFRGDREALVARPFVLALATLEARLRRARMRSASEPFESGPLGWSGTSRRSPPRAVRHRH
jgi:hypothetical protein